MAALAAPPWPNPEKEPWAVELFRRHPEDDRNETVPAAEFLRDECPPAMSRGLMAIFSAVAALPPPWSWQQGITFRAMAGDMDGFYEARKKQGVKLYRLFCLLERDPVPGLERPTIAVITGMWKPDETAFRKADYNRVKDLGREYRRREPRSLAP